MPTKKLFQIVLCLVLTLTFIPYFPKTSEAASAGFTIKDDKIIDPQGREFISKGVSTHYSTFMAHTKYGLGNEYSEIQYKRTDRDFDRMKELGINTVRIFVSPSMFSEVSAADAKIYKDRLTEVINKARARGFVVLLANSYGEYNKMLDFLKYLATTYKSDPYIWITPSNEWRCADRPDGSLGFDSPDNCSNWQLWKQEHDQYIKAIRDQGFNNPLLVNVIEYSWNFEQILNPTYKLVDSQNKIIYGNHRYGNNNVNMCDTQGIGHRLQDIVSDEDKAILKQGNERCGVTVPANYKVNGFVEVGIEWAKFTDKVPIISDEIGGDNGPNVKNLVSWNKSFINEFELDWILNKGGDGIIAYTWMWSDKSSLVESFEQYDYDEAKFLSIPINLTEWGNIFINDLVKKVPDFRTTTTVKKADFNKDGCVNAPDLSLLLFNYKTTDPVQKEKYNLIGTPEVDAADLSNFLFEFDKDRTCQPTKSI